MTRSSQTRGPSPRRARLVRLAAPLLAAGLALAGCPVDSRNPLGPADQAVEDSRLHGVWIGRNENGPAYFHIFRPKDAAAGTIEVVLVSHEADGLGEADRYVGHLTRFEDLTFANMRGPLETDDPSGRYTIVEYQIAKDGALELRLLDEATVRAAIAAAAIAGERNADGTPTEHITDSPERLRAFLAATDRSTLFEPLIRLDPAAPRP